MTPEPRYGLAGRLARPFLRSKLTPVIVLASILLGLVAVWLTPREEEPQIVVPMVDVMVPFPGAAPREVETQLVTPLERRLWGIPGVEYLYSSSRANVGFITVRFKVNEPLEPSLVKVRQELDAHPELVPAGAMRPVVRALTIDDVPFLTLTLHAEEPLPAGELRKLEIQRQIRTEEVRQAESQSSQVAAELGALDRQIATLDEEAQRSLKLEHDSDAAKGVMPPPWSEGASAYVHWLMDQDRKSTALKTLQGRIWQEGYRRGELHGEVFPDVPVALKKWNDAGIDVRIYSSGSILAQQLLFSTTRDGDLTRYLRGYFDTTTGAKTESSRPATFTVTSFPRQPLKLWAAEAMSSLPTPLSPVMRSGCGLFATAST